MRRVFRKLSLVVFLSLSSQAQDFDPPTIYRRMISFVIQNDSCLQKNKISFQQSYTWTIVPISVEYAGVREIIHEHGNIQVRVLSRSGRALPSSAKVLFNRMADLSIMDFFPARIESTQCDFSPIGPMVMKEGETFYVLESHDSDPEIGTIYERTYWIRANTLEPARVEMLISDAKNRRVLTRMRVEFSKPTGLPCLIPVTIEQDDLKKTEIGAETVSRLRVSNSNFRF